MTILLGTSGWQYRDWRGAFYPPRLAQREWLQHYAARFATVEINNSFYRLPDRGRFAAWAEATPDDFVLCPKISRYLTHMKKLKDAEEPVERFTASAAGLGSKSGPWLLQLPPNFPADAERLDRTLSLFAERSAATMGRAARIAVELRHDSWFTDEVRALLAEHDAALVWADRGSKLISPDWRTAGWGFVRFHEGAATWPCYGRTALASRAELIAATFGDEAEVFVFFNNDPRGCAIRDARWFAAACEREGLSVTRRPAARDITLVEPG